MAYPAATRILFEAGDDAVDGGGTIRDQLLHTSYAITFEPERAYRKLTIPLENGLDMPVNVILYGRSEAAGDPFHQLGAVVPMLAGAQAIITLTDWWKFLLITVQETSGFNPTVGDFLAKLMPVMDGRR